MNRKPIAACLMALPLLLATGCGESHKVILFQQGAYQGKPDTPPWDSRDFKGNKAEWERAITTRANGQNEYVRIGS